MREHATELKTEEEAVTRTTTTSGTHWEEEFGYARAVRVGERVFVSGTTATGKDGVVGVGDSAAQARFIFGRIERALKRLGSCLEDVVRTRVYVTTAGDWRSVAEVHGEVFRKIQPANTTVRAELIGEEFLVEIEAEAIVGVGPADTP